ncbi:MAG: polynucleotide adenylyltransferase PcnB [Polyangiales bacterium]
MAVRAAPIPNDLHRHEAEPAALPEPVRHARRFDDARIDPDALKVVRRLTQAGYEAYLVGGAVRDLLLSRRAKDFDIATSARPEDVKRVFRSNCRIIGRRFRLAHVFFTYGGKTFEVATYRKNPVGAEEPEESVDLLIRSDNVFGVAHEDAERRDFTINALFYDHDRGEILDWVEGMADIDLRLVRTIGQPDVRFREDPVRILRAIKFAARLDFQFEPAVYDAIVANREELARAARPRVFEEILRLMRGGAARQSIYLAWDTGVLAVILPELSTFLDDSVTDPTVAAMGDSRGGPASRVFRALAEIDRITAERGAPPDDTVLLATLLREPIREWSEGARSREEWRRAIEEKLSEVGERMAITRRIAEGLARVYAAEARLRAGRTGGFMATPLGALARDLALIGLIGDDAPADQIERVRAVPTAEPGPATSPRASAGRSSAPRGRGRTRDRAPRF